MSLPGGNTNQNSDVAEVVGPVARSYQLKLLDYATKRNCIIYLPTGSGKTFVAILALRRFSHELQKPLSQGGKRSIFMCNTVELARQQFNEVRKLTNLRCGFYVGERDVDNWNIRKWKIELDENQVLIGTTQVFVDLMVHKHLKISDLSLVIIDECHHGTKSHPMHQFMSFFQYVENKGKLPRVIGLTGVLLKTGNLTDILTDLKNLEATFRGNIVTVGNIDEYHNVLIYSTKPREEFVVYPDGYQTPFASFEHSITRIVEECINVIDTVEMDVLQQRFSKNLGSVREPNKVKYIKNLLKDFLYQMNDFGIYAASVAIMSPIIDFEIKKRQEPVTTLRNIYRYVISQCELIRHMIIKKIGSLSDDDDDDDEDDLGTIILNFSKPKLQALLKFLKTQFENKRCVDISCLIFVDRRYSAKCLYYVIKNYVEADQRLRNIIFPSFMIGRNSSIHDGIETILERKWSNKAVEMFRRKECNLIVCSSVLEEGIDVQSCNYVIALDPLKKFSSYIQTKGRARSNGSLYAVFCPKSKLNDVSLQLKKYLDVDKKLKEYLIHRTVDTREDPNENDISGQFVEKIKPFTTATGSRLHITSALQLLNRYIMTLPVDSFGIHAGWWDPLPKTENDKHLVSLQLPLQSTVKDVIMSEPMESYKMAKMSAAFNACVMLYKNGEINERLLPVTKRECVTEVSNVFFNHWNGFTKEDNKVAGTKKNCRIYPSKCPKELTGALPVVGELCYAYIIRIKPEFEADSESEHIVAMLNSKINYAFLSRNKLPKLAMMPLFMTQGTLSVQIAHEPVQLVINSSDELALLCNYHTMILRDLLKVWKPFFVLDKTNEKNSFLIAPIREGEVASIDWPMVRKFQQLAPLKSTSIAKRSKKTYIPEDYLGRVVNTWYSLNDDTRFVVTKIRMDLTPMSPFANDQFTSFAEYIENKYQERVWDRQQFLLEVKAITSRTNFCINAKGKDGSGKKTRKQDTVILIPELCHNFQYPGDMWLKAIFLPCIIHRLNYMLLAEELRVRINDFLGIKEPDYCPKPLIIDTSLRRVFDYSGDSDMKAPTSMLPPLKTTRHETGSEMKSLLDTNEGNWKSYMEPRNLSDNQNQIYPVEVDYYYKFVSGLAVELDELKITEEEDYGTHLKPYKPKQMSGPLQDSLPKICDVPSEEKLRIDVLERSIHDEQIFRSAEQCEFVAALTTAAANDVFDMERLEVLGDSFLKFSISLYLMHKFPKWNEGFLTEVKSKFVSNRNLLYCLMKTDIPNCICSSEFQRVDWLPPLAALPLNIINFLKSTPTGHISRALYDLSLSEEEIASGECKPESMKLICTTANSRPTDTNELGNTELSAFLYQKSISDKVVADTLEAILGVCLKNYGIHKAFRMLHFFGILTEPTDLLPNLLKLNFGSPLIRANISPTEVDGFLINYSSLEENLGYKFRNRAYLLRALTHPSFSANRITGCYQELEFIGDAILDFLVSCYIFEKCDKMNPGQLTDLRSALVNNVTLASVCVRHKFHLFLLSENAALSESIKNFAQFQETQGHRVTSQVKILMEEDQTKHNTSEQKCWNMATNIDVPKTLGDIFEALVAAVFLDSNDLKCTWRVIYRLMAIEINDFISNVPLDPVRQLYEYRGANPKFGEATENDGAVMMQCTFTCRDVLIDVCGFGKNKEQAKKSASKMALQILLKK